MLTARLPHVYCIYVVRGIDRLIWLYQDYSLARFFLMTHLVGDANNTASGTSASVTSLLRLLVSALAEVISSSVDDNGTANDALGADQLDQLVCDTSLRIALTISLEVAQVTDVALLVLGGTVCLVVGVEVGTGGCAAVCVVAKGVDVHTTGLFDVHVCCEESA